MDKKKKEEEKKGDFRSKMNCSARFKSQALYRRCEAMKGAT